MNSEHSRTCFEWTHKAWYVQRWDPICMYTSLCICFIRRVDFRHNKRNIWYNTDLRPKSTEIQFLISLYTFVNWSFVFDIRFWICIININDVDDDGFTIVNHSIVQSTSRMLMEYILKVLPSNEQWTVENILDN